ncbi:MAG: N-acetylmuramoyl-L-alanine amidase [Treponema sp.]|nr:N-acetylmuramoyl-L-alanine amidase [Treponema sp.]
MCFRFKYFFTYFIFLFIYSFSSFAVEKLNLLSVADEKGILVYWDSLSNSGILEKNGHQLSFQAGQKIVLEDCKRLVLLDAPEIDSNGILYVTRTFLNKAETFFGTEKPVEDVYKVEAILIDPGHGGKDPGAQSNITVNGKTVTIREKDVNLEVANYLYQRLKTAYPDKQILMTRNKDVYLTLGQRTEIANSVKLNDNGAILYVSIHANSSMDKSASGFEVWYLSPGYRRQVLNPSEATDVSLQPILNAMTEEEYTTESILIAKFITDGLKTSLGSLSNSRGIKAEEWFVVRNAKMPAVLIETGFLTNEKEAKLLYDKSYLKKVSDGIYNGLAAFVTHFERSRGFTGSN